MATEQEGIKIYSLNLIVYLHTRGFDDYLLMCNNNLFYAVFEYTDELQQATDQYKADYKLQEFLHSFSELRKLINAMRCG